MRKFSYTFALLLAASIIFTSSNDASSDKGVVINGVRWATYNVETPGTFARNSTDAGGHFTFDEAQNVCPRGWRLPTREELQLLVETDRGWITRNGVNGRLFGTAPNEVFLPAAGLRGTAGALHHVGSLINYWSSSARTASVGWGLWSGGGVNNFDRNLGFSVRCVAE